MLKMKRSKVPAMDLLDRIMADEEISEEFMRAIIGRDLIHEETLHIDFKAAHEEKTNDRDWADLLRKYVSAFANSAGGTLVLGVAEVPNAESGFTRKALGCVGLKTKELETWATRCIQSMAPYCTVLPRVMTITVDGQHLLLVAVSRSGQMVPVVGNRGLTYYLRIGDSTVAAPDYLLGDLFIGHRNYPNFVVKDLEVSWVQSTHADHDKLVPLTFKARCLNDGITHADRITYGIINVHVGGTTDLGSYLGSLVNVVDRGIGVAHAPRAIPSLAAFQSHPLDFGLFNMEQLPGKHTLKFAIYIATAISPPVWFQASLDFTVVQREGGSLFNAPKLYRAVIDVDSITVAELHGERPMVILYDEQPE